MGVLAVTTEELPQGVDRIVVAGEVDLASIDVLYSHLAAAFGRGTRRLVLDLTRLRFLDSSMMIAITKAAKHAREPGGDVALVYGDPNVRRFIELYGLSSEIGGYETVEDAAAALRAPEPGA